MNKKNESGLQPKMHPWAIKLAMTLESKICGIPKNLCSLFNIGLHIGVGHFIAIGTLEIQMANKILSNDLMGVSMNWRNLSIDSHYAGEPLLNFILHFERLMLGVANAIDVVIRF